MKKLLCVLAAVSALCGIWAAPALSHPIEKILDKSVKVVHFLPGGLHGIYNKGEKVSFSMFIDPKKSGKMTVTVTVLDIHKKILEKINISRNVTAGKRFDLAIPVKDPGKFGHFTLDAIVRLNGKMCVYTQSAFAVLRPAPKNPDTYFILDGRNPHYNFDSRPALKRLGVDTIGLGTLRSHIKDPAITYRAFFKKPSKVKFSQVIGYLGLGEGNNPRPKKLRKAGLYPYDEAYYKREDDIVRTCAMLGKGVIKHWCLLQEVDGHMTLYPPTSVMTDHIIRVQRASRILRKIDPDCKISVVNSCGDDFFSNNFTVTRMLLRETAKYIDYFAIDAYSGTWNGLLSDLEEPEKYDRFKKLLSACSRVAQEFILPAKFYMAERGYFIPYQDALNSPKSMDMMNFNARSIIIARGDVNVISYSRHAALFWHYPYAIKRGYKPEKMSDGGLWRCIFDVRNRFSLQPRPSLAAFATIARLMAHVTDPDEIRITKEIYSYSFKRPNGKRIAAVWSTGKDTKTQFTLPCDAILHDLMGNERKLKKGKHTLVLTQSPCFLELSANKQTVRNLLKKAYFPDIKTFDGTVKAISFNSYKLILTSFSNRPLKIRFTPSDKGLKCPAFVDLAPGASKTVTLRGKASKLTLDDSARKLTLQVPEKKVIAVPYGKKPVHIVTLKYPDHIRPLAALRAERNHFRGDGSDITADFSASWDAANLYLQFVIKDKVHIQRHSGSSIWKDDCIQIGIDAGNNALPASMVTSRGFDKDDYLFGLALGKSGPVAYAWVNGKNRSGTCTFKAYITRKGNQTVYKTAIPWSVMKEIKPRKGTVFGFSFLVMDNNDAAFRAPPYRLEWTAGIAGKQNPYFFQQMILK